MGDKLTIGIVGMGGFAAFVARAFMKVDGIRIKSVSDIDPASASQLAKEIDATVYAAYAQLLFN